MFTNEFVPPIVQKMLVARDERRMTLINEKMKTKMKMPCMIAYKQTSLALSLIFSHHGGS